MINDYDSWEGRAAAAAKLELTIRSCIGVPLKSGTGVVGVLGMAYVDPGLQFGKEEVELLNRFAQLASISLDNARLFATAQKARDKAIEAIQRISEQNRMLESLSTKLSKYLLSQVYARIAGIDQSDEGKVIRHRQDGMRIEVDLEKLSANARSEAVQAVERLLTKLKN